MISTRSVETFLFKMLRKGRARNFGKENCGKNIHLYTVAGMSKKLHKINSHKFKSSTCKNGY